MSDLIRLADSERWTTIEEVARLKHRGLTDTAIAKQLGLTRVETQNLYNEYKDILSNDQESRDRARDQLNLMVAHYDILIKKLYDLLDELDQENFTHQIGGQKVSAIKQIGDLEAKRLEAMQKAGILDASDLGDELALMEEQRDMVLDILRNDLCPVCRKNVMEKLGVISRQAEVVVQYE